LSALGFRLSAFGRRLSAFGSRLTAPGSRAATSGISSLTPGALSDGRRVLVTPFGVRRARKPRVESRTPARRELILAGVIMKVRLRKVSQSDFSTIRHADPDAHGVRKGARLRTPAATGTISRPF